MLNENEETILKCMQDTEYLKFINATPQDLEKAIKFAKNEIEELENIVDIAKEKGENISELCKRLKGHNETFNEKYPNHNYFDLNFKSLLITINQPIDKGNKILPLEVSKDKVSVYPDNITRIATEPIVELNFNQSVDFKKIYKELEKQIQQRQQDESEI